MTASHPIPDMNRIKTPTVIQMEATECGAAALGIILSYWGKFVPLEELRVACGVSRDGSNAYNIVLAAENYGLDAKAYSIEIDQLSEMDQPSIIFWEFNHFVVFEGIKKKSVYINDPGTGPRTITFDEFDAAFSGVILTFKPKKEFAKHRLKRSFLSKLFSRLFGYKTTIIFLIIIGLALVVPGLAVPFFSKIFVDEILVKHMQSWIKPLLLGMGITALLRFSLSWLRAVFLLKLEVSMALNESGKFFFHLLNLPIIFFNQRLAGDLNHRVLLNDRVANLLAGKLTSAFLDLFMVGFYLALMLFYDTLMTGVGILIAVMNFILLKMVARKRIDENTRLKYEENRLIGTGMNGLQQVETIKANGMESEFFSIWAGYQAKMFNSEQKLGRLTIVIMTVTPLLGAFNMAVILTIGGFRVIEGAISMGMLVAFQSLMSSFLRPINNLVSMGRQIQDVKSDINLLDDVFSHEEVASNRATEPPDNGLIKLSGDIEIKNLSYGYNPLEPPFITDFNLRFKPGHRVALIGKSGCGKSTISKLVAGLYEPWSGEILFDNKKRQTFTSSVLNHSIAMVDQDIWLFEGSVRENVTMWDDSIPETLMVQAAKDALIHDEIAARVGGYLSRVEERGANFSEGQRQRLEIARALILKPSILILDEATSSLDALCEKHIDDHIRRYGCTCLIVAHRLSTVRDCDEIIVLDSGKIVQRGTHESMKDISGPYQDLIKGN